MLGTETWHKKDTAGKRICSTLIRLYEWNKICAIIVRKFNIWLFALCQTLSSYVQKFHLLLKTKERLFSLHICVITLVTSQITDSWNNIIKFYLWVILRLCSLPMAKYPCRRQADAIWNSYKADLSVASFWRKQSTAVDAGLPATSYRSFTNRETP